MKPLSVVGASLCLVTTFGIAAYKLCEARIAAKRTTAKVSVENNFGLVSSEGHEATAPNIPIPVMITSGEAQVQIKMLEMKLA